MVRRLFCVDNKPDQVGFVELCDNVRGNVTHTEALSEIKSSWLVFHTKLLFTKVII